jgi:hypothetical protein
MFVKTVVDSFTRQKLFIPMTSKMSVVDVMLSMLDTPQQER